MYLLQIILFSFFSFNNNYTFIPSSRYINNICSGNNSVLITTPYSFGIYDPIKDSIVYYSNQNKKIINAISISNGDTYIIFHRNSLTILNPYLNMYEEIEHSGHLFSEYGIDRDIYLKTVRGKIFKITGNWLQEDNNYSKNWINISKIAKPMLYIELAPYMIRKGNQTYFYTAIDTFKHLIFAGTDRYGLFIINKYTGQKKHIINGIPGTIRGIGSFNNKLIIYSENDIMLYENNSIDFLLDTTFFYPHFSDKINDVSIINNVIYITGQHKIYKISNNNIIPIIHYNSGIMRKITNYKEGILICTDNGLLYYKNNKFDYLLRNQPVNDVIVRGNVVFIATERGVYFSNNDSLFTKFAGIPSFPLKELAIDDNIIAGLGKDGTLYIHNLSNDSLFSFKAGTNLQYGNIFTSDSIIFYIDNNIIITYPRIDNYSYGKMPNNILGFSILDNKIILLTRAGLSIFPLNDIFPELSH